MKKVFFLFAILLAVPGYPQEISLNLPYCYEVDFTNFGASPVEGLITRDTNPNPEIIDGLIQVNPKTVEPGYSVLVAYHHKRGFGSRDRTGSVVITPDQYWKSGGVLLRALAQKLEIPFKNLVNPNKEELVILSVDPVRKGMVNSTADENWLIE